MKQFTYLISFVFVLCLLSIGCEKEDNFGLKGLRLSKFDSSSEMNNPIMFEYDTKGLLIKVIQNDYYYEIEYNTDNLPIKVTDFYQKFFITETNILWSEEGFQINESKYKLKNGRITKEIELDESIEDTLEYTELAWYENDSLMTKTYYSDPEMQGYNTVTTQYSFTSVIHPLDQINIAVLLSLFGGDIIFDNVEFQNDQCMDYYLETDDTKYHVKESSITYEVNENNYPVKATIHITGRYGKDAYDFVENRYFEYESY